VAGRGAGGIVFEFIFGLCYCAIVSPLLDVYLVALPRAEYHSGFLGESGNARQFDIPLAVSPFEICTAIFELLWS
jgi:hypothetical protein